MTFFVIIAAAAGLVWAAVFARRGALLIGATATIVLGYVLPHAFWNAHVGVPLTVDRAAMAGLLVMLLAHWQWEKLVARRIGPTDWLLAALVLYLTIRCALTPAPPAEFRAHVGPWWRIVAGFWMPAALYVVARVAPLNQRTWRAMLWGLVGLGGYLALTGIAEVQGQWWAVFPRFIADPTLGTHFGRARGPALMSASLGVYLTVSFWAAWFVWPRAPRAAKIALIVLMLVMGAAIYATYTRSIWLGLVAALAVIPLLQTPRRLRVPLAGLCLLIGATGFAAVGHRVTHLGRKDTDGSAAHSVYQRASFAYLSWEMFKDEPLWGCGVGRFYDKKLPYLSDRRQQIELDSLRYLDHHNTLLSILVETGLVGFALFVGLLVAWTKAACDAVRRFDAGSWRHAHGLFALAVLITYFTTALFHDLTLSPTEHWLLFLSAGVTVALLTEGRATATLPAPAALFANFRRPRPFASQYSTRVATPNSLRNSRSSFEATVRQNVRLFGMTIDAVTMPEAARRVLAWCAAPRDGRCKYVVTPNVDHAVMYQTNASLRTAYAGAAMVLADGAPVVLASRLLGRPLPERVAGSDLAPALFRRASQARGERPRRRLRVFLLGAGPGVAEQASERIAAKWPGVDVVGTLSPPVGFEHDEQENVRILTAIAAAGPDLLIVGLGAPKQELWVSRHADRLDAKAALCIGATIDFLAGQRRRAPAWMQSCGLEWIHRLLSEPGRLARRYAHDAWVFPQLVWREWTASRL